MEEKNNTTYLERESTLNKNEASDGEPNKNYAERKEEDVSHISHKAENLNFWKIVSLVLGILLILSFVLRGGSNVTGSVVGAISPKTAGEKVLDFAYKQGIRAKIVNTSDKNGFYEIILNVDGQESPIYVTKDGKNLIPFLVPLDIDLSSITPPKDNGSNSQKTAKTTRVTVSADDDARIGSKDAPVEIIEFSDFQCPFCARAEPTIKQILAEYGDKVTFVYRDFPLDSIHPMATPAAIAAECVREQGKDEAFFKYHDKIFENQQSLSIPNLKKWAKDMGYNIDKCLDEQRYLSEVRKDLLDAQAAGGQGTPYFLINGKPLSGAQPFSVFKQIIDEELAKAQA